MTNEFRLEFYVCHGICGNPLGTPLEMRWVVLVRTRYFCFVLSCFPGSSHLSALFSRVNMKCDFIGDSARDGNSSFGIFRVQVNRSGAVGQANLATI